jgi:tetratricopeptide (TPR) repeat protein
MKKNLIAQKRTWLWLIVISLLIMVLATTSCDLIFPKSGQNLNKFIESYWGIDVSSPMQIALMIMGMKKVGNTEAFNGLTAYSHCRSELYQERGSKLLGTGDTDGARAAYNQAFLWAQDDTPHRASDKAGIYYQYANTYMKDAQKQTSITTQPPYYRAAGQNMLKAANLEPVPANKAFYYREAAFHLAAGGDKKTGKQAYDQAAKLEPNSLALEQISGLFK